MCHRQGAAPAPCNLNSRFSLCRGGQGNGREFNINYTFIPLSDHKFLIHSVGCSFPSQSPYLAVFFISLAFFHVFFSPPSQWSCVDTSVVDGLVVVTNLVQFYFNRAIPSILIYDLILFYLFNLCKINIFNVDLTLNVNTGT